MSNPIIPTYLQCLHLKDGTCNLISAAFHMITITLISMSLVDLTWFNISGTHEYSLPLGEFFWFGYTTTPTIYYPEYEYVTTTIVNVMRTMILLCFMAIIFSLLGFFIDIMGSKSLAHIMGKYAVPGMCTVLWLIIVICISLYVSSLLEKSQVDLYPSVETTVSYGCGFYMFVASAINTLFGIFYNTLLVRQPSFHSTDDDRCIIDGFEDGLDTFNCPTPPPPYNTPPPPYTP